MEKEITCDICGKNVLMANATPVYDYSRGYYIFECMGCVEILRQKRRAVAMVESKRRKVRA
jgi:hypothetical protein